MRLESGKSLCGICTDSDLSSLENSNLTSSELQPWIFVSSPKSYLYVQFNVKRSSYILSFALGPSLRMPCPHIVIAYSIASFRWRLCEGRLVKDKIMEIHIHKSEVTSPNSLPPLGKRYKYQHSTEHAEFDSFLER